MLLTSEELARSLVQRLQREKVWKESGVARCFVEFLELVCLGQQVGRLQAEAQALREYGIQVRELFQAEIDIRQNRIMRILTIVTTIFLPLPLVAGW